MHRKEHAVACDAAHGDMTLPVAAPTGTGAMTLEALQLVGVELIPLK